MLAGDIYAPCKVRLVDIPLEDARVSAEADEPKILFRPTLACLCGSDLLFFERDYPEYFPSVGQSLHEMIGVVEESESPKWSPGDRVLCVPYEHYGFYERYWIAASRAVAVDPRPAPREALMAQPLGTVIYALKKIPPVIDRDVVILGQGPMGLLFTLALRNLGARTITTVDPIPERREVSLQVGATQAVDPQSDDVGDALHQCTGSQTADIVVEAVGHREQVLNDAIRLCRHGGTVLFFGVPTETIDGIRMQEFFLKNLTLVTSVLPDFARDFPLAMRWIAEQRVDVRPLLTHQFTIDQIQDAYDLFHQKRDGAIKVLLDLPE